MNEWMNERKKKRKKKERKKERKKVRKEGRKNEEWLGSKGRFVYGWQAKLCDPLVTHGPYLSAFSAINSAVYFYFKTVMPRGLYYDAHCTENIAPVFLQISNCDNNSGKIFLFRTLNNTNERAFPSH